MSIIDCTTILTETDRYGIIFFGMITLAAEYDTFSCDGHLMDEPFVTKDVNDTIECREVHTIVSFPDEFFFEICESDTSGFSELFDEAFTRESDARDRHIERDEGAKKFF